MRILFTLLLGLVLLIWLPGFFLSFVSELEYLVKHHAQYIWALVGLGAYVPIHFVLIRRWHGLQTFEHELTHAVFSVLFLRRITRFIATSRNGGLVEHKGDFGGRFGDTAITLAPYFCPTFTMIPALLRPLLGVDFAPYADGAIGFTFGFHAFTTISETAQAFKQRRFIAVDGTPIKSDVGKYGMVFSAVYIAFFLIFFHGIVLGQLHGGYGATWGFLKAGAVNGCGHAAWLFQWLYHQAAQRIS